MADVKISQLPAASTPLAGTEQIPLVQDATTKQITVSNLLTSANLGTPSAINLANATNVPMDEASGVLAVANGGSGTATPALVAGTNVTISGSWPNQTINSTYSGAVTSVTGTAPVVSSGGTTPAISMAAATGSVNGYLTSTDWTTFNNKLTSGGALGTPSSGTATNLTGLPLTTGVTGLLPVANGGTGTATPNLVAGSNVTISGTWPNQTIAAAGAAQVYPGAGIANSTGSAWGTSYTTTGSGTVVALATSAALTNPSANQINDTNGAQILGLSPTASAVDYVTIKNGIGTGVPLHVYADGSSTNIGLHIQPKGSGLVTISDGTDFNKGIRFRSSGSAASAVTLLDAVSTAGRVVTLPDATTTLVGRDTTDTLTNKTIAFGSNTFSGTLAVANGGTGTATPSLVAGTNVTITGTWPNQTIAASGGGGSGTVTSVSGTGTVNGLTLTGTVTTSGSLTLGGTLDLSSPPAIGGTAAAAGAFTTLSASSTVTISGGTANGVTYLNGSKVLTSGSALTFDGTYFTAQGTRFADSASNTIYRSAGGLQISTDGSPSGSNISIRPNYGDFIVSPGGTEGMRLTSTGLGIGTSSPAYKLDVQTAAGRFQVRDLGGSSLKLMNSTTGGNIGIDSAGGITLIYANGTETARFDASYNFLVGTTSDSPGYNNTTNGVSLRPNDPNCFSISRADYVQVINQNTIDAGIYNLITFRAGGSGKGNIVSNGTGVSYNTSSDYRLKNTIAPMTGALAKVALLKPCTYKWNSDGSDGEGFIAHELAEVCPQAVSGEKDAVDAEGNIKSQGIDASFLVATLTAALQELNAKFEAYVASHP